MEVQSVTPVVVTPVNMTGKAGANANGSTAAAGTGAGFGNVLGSVLGGSQSVQSDPSGQAAVIASLMSAGLNPSLLLNLMPQTDEAEGLDQAAAQLMELLNDGQDGVQQDLLQNSDLLSWIAAVNQLLQVANTQQSDTAENVQQTNAGAAETSTEMPSRNAFVQSTVIRFMEELSKNPQNPALQQLAASFQQTVQPLVQLFSKLTAAHEQANVAALNGLFDNVESTGDEMTAVMSLLQARAKGNAATSASTTDNGAKVWSQLIGNAPLQLVPKPQTHFAIQQAKSALLYPQLNTADIDDSTAITAQPADTAQTLPAFALSLQDASRLLTGTADKAVQQQVQAENFAQDMSQLMKNMKITHAPGFSEAKISLMPEHLGNVDVRITLQNGLIVAQFMADSPVGKDLLENQMPQLRAALQSQGLQVEKLEVVQGFEASSQLFQDNRQQQSAQQFFQQNKNGLGRLTGVADSFAAELEQEAAARTFMYGNSFNVTA